jgi:hypothetical protein
MESMRVNAIALAISAFVPQALSQQKIPRPLKKNWRNWKLALKVQKTVRHRLKRKFRFSSNNRLSPHKKHQRECGIGGAVTPSAVPKLTLSGYGDIKFYGDVEFNMDAASKTGSLTSMKTSANKDWAPQQRWDINGRLLLGFDGYRRMDNGNFAGFSVQPLADLTGKMNLDDAVFFFGTENDWQVKWAALKPTTCSR